MFQRDGDSTKVWVCVAASEPSKFRGSGPRLPCQIHDVNLNPEAGYVTSESTLFKLLPHLILYMEDFQFLAVIARRADRKSSCEIGRRRPSPAV